MGQNVSNSNKKNKKSINSGAPLFNQTVAPHKHSSSVRTNNMLRKDIDNNNFQQQRSAIALIDKGNRRGAYQQKNQYQHQQPQQKRKQIDRAAQSSSKIHQISSKRNIGGNKKQQQYVSKKYIHENNEVIKRSNQHSYYTPYELQEQISRADFHFERKITETGTNKEQTFWLAKMNKSKKGLAVSPNKNHMSAVAIAAQSNHPYGENNYQRRQHKSFRNAPPLSNPSSSASLKTLHNNLYFIKQIDKLKLHNNNRINVATLQLSLLIEAAQQQQAIEQDDRSVGQQGPNGIDSDSEQSDEYEYDGDCYLRDQRNQIQQQEQDYEDFAGRESRQVTAIKRRNRKINGHQRHNLYNQQEHEHRYNPYLKNNENGRSLEYSPGNKFPFLNRVLYAFQDYRYCYMVQQHLSGFTLDYVLKNHVFTEEQTKYVVGVIIQIFQYFHERGLGLSELEPVHFFVEKSTGKLKLVELFNPLQIDTPYPYEMVSEPSTYSAPEILAKDTVLAESDYYTLGMIMYEMMTQKNIVKQELAHMDGNIQRNHILAQQIQLKKYNLPEGWNPQAADFLIKLLIKNPTYRLGRYGSFQLRYHPWLQNYNWEILGNRNGINLIEKCFEQENVEIQNFDEKQKKSKTNESNLLKIDRLKQKQFVRIFEPYSYNRQKYNKEQFQESYDTLQDDSLSSNSDIISERYYNSSESQFSEYISRQEQVQFKKKRKSRVK